MQGITHSYDANGNLTGDGTNSWVYDVENRLVAARGLYAANLRYDPLGRLHETVTGVEDTNINNDITVRRLYDGGALVAEYDQTGALLRRFVHGPNTGADTPLVWYEGPTMQQSAARMLNTDLQGSVTSVTDFGGAPLGINRYDEYGRPQAGNMGRFQYTGQAWLPEIGLYYYKARMYSPTLGRFMQTDPIGYADGVNWYNYVGGDPVNFVDPSGLFQVPKNEGIPSIVIIGRRSRSLCEISPDLCTGPTTNAGLTEILDVIFDLGLTLPDPNEIVVTAKNYICPLPTIGLSFTARAYAKLGGGYVTELAYDPNTGRLEAVFGVDVGVGVGGEIGGESRGTSVTVGRTIPDGWSGSTGVNANVRVGPFAAGTGYTLSGRDGMGFGGASGGIRPGSTGATVNANVGVRAGYGGKIVSICGDD